MHKQYQSIRKLMFHNFKSIKLLLQQAGSLTKIITDLKEENCEKHSKTIKELEKTQESIVDSIGELIEQTGKLFEQYEEFVSKL